ncbi:MAG: hypothetical protein IPM57_04355 [Oligoflexia bacterium]|nr:hypothetical protein [Oligoflexia bacterium]
MPLTTNIIALSFGLVVMVCLAVVLEKKILPKLWVVAGLMLGFVILSQIIIKITEPINFFRGGLVYDAHTQMLSLWALILSALIHFSGGGPDKKGAVHHLILTFALTFFAVFTIHSNRVYFTAIGVIGMLISATGVLFDNYQPEEKFAHLQSMAKKIFLISLFGAILTATLISLTGQTQIEEVHLALSRQPDLIKNILSLQILFIICSFVVGGFFPINGLFGTLKDKADNLDIVLCSGLFGIVGIQVFIKYVLTVFYSISINGKYLESIVKINLLDGARLFVAFILFVTPLIMIGQKRMWEGLVLLISNAFWIIIFVLTIAEKALLAHVYLAVPAIIFALVLLATSLKKLEINNASLIEDWLGRGRKGVGPAIATVFAIWALSGFPPFYLGILAQKTLSVNKIENIILLWNLCLVGIYALRLSVMAFHAPLKFQDIHIEQTKFDKAYSRILILLLIFMGIFHQPLYKYGAYSIRHLFGDY